MKSVIFAVIVLVFFIFLFHKFLDKLGLSDRDGSVMFMGACFVQGVQDIGMLVTSPNSAALFNLLFHMLMFIVFYNKARQSLSD